MSAFKEEDYTEWFPPTMLPGQVGVFRTKRHPDGIITFRYWDGKKFGMSGFSPNQAKRESHVECAVQDFWFQGLKEDPVRLVKGFQ